ncbi:uncharacterized protein LOC117639027 [Thrips palmi]|uniref:Uncharacterized protein LOC117639027 n=1 Tax=Thrips palmi TaxID=161013 RepID=A0A6P8XTM4_THRPL|nr:uncharacterized protein LOC117639027 [Thrips palmi]XP_034230238.1 uncharacterized protein LOC117639027 [Thrips palmi]XP_034230239.1 uncharacterized protein LOC117639027 [Thrips palmi]XP_034230240.1 uncharacterized protein LOC117639027 [Thrips palmi]XP_034230241.1 uncharacterized protein LOC117639027 [Thrips palmi]XP_034230242.1 uncharacterized protein LOC117639027 [Thrips palmi]XP_034230243.1 uncharacterized protein LOC117639027 [Thrips palmi]XP_034230244.1 uncharacterized protein LOC1176
MSVPGVLHVHQFDLKSLECPVTWGTGYAPLEACEDMLDKLCLAPTPWAEVVERYRLAWSFWQNSRLDQARTLLVECFMRLLPDPVFHRHCGIIADHRPALRLVLDSMWAAMSITTLTDNKQVAYLREFIGDVKPLSQLGDDQRAAVCAVRGRLASGGGAEDRKWFREAIRLSPGEGEWRHLLGWVLQDARNYKGTPSAEEISLLRAAYQHRKNPDTVLRLARCVAACGPSQRAEAEALVAEALRLFPNHPRALTNAANTLYMMRDPGPQTAREALELYQRALVAAGERAFIHMKLGSLWSHYGDKKKARRHYKAAARLNPSACNQFATAISDYHAGL